MDSMSRNSKRPTLLVAPGVPCRLAMSTASPGDRQPAEGALPSVASRAPSPLTEYDTPSPPSAHARAGALSRERLDAPENTMAPSTPEPSGEGSSHSSPIQPGRHSHAPATRLPFAQARVQGAAPSPGSE